MKSVVIIGAGGHGKVVADIVLKSGDRVLGFLDDNQMSGEKIAGIPVLGKIREYIQFRDKAEFIIAIGNANVREQISRIMEKVRWYTAIHPTAVISNINVSIANGSVIMANAVVNACSVIGKHCIINTGAIVEHDNVIADFVHISVGANLAGTVHVGKNTWIGIGASVSNNITICSDCIIGAGAVVVKDITEAGTYIGIPAKRINKVGEEICLLH